MVTCVLLRGSATLNDVFYLKEDLSDDEADVFAFKNIITKAQGHPHHQHAK